MDKAMFHRIKMERDKDGDADGEICGENTDKCNRGAEEGRKKRLQGGTGIM